MSFSVENPTLWEVCPPDTNFSGFNSTYLDIPASYVEKYFNLPEINKILFYVHVSGN